MASNKNEREENHNSPRVLELKWGFMNIERFGQGKDFKLYPGGAEEWDWRKTNTKHVPGIQPKDVEDLLNRGAEIIVLSKGMDLQLHTSKETMDFLKSRNMEQGKNYFIEESRKAVEIYNELVNDQKPVGALIHSTC